MGYKLIALDIDGTLLNSSNQITENVKEAIRKSKRKRCQSCVMHRETSKGC